MPSKLRCFARGNLYQPGAILPREQPCPVLNACRDNYTEPSRSGCCLPRPFVALLHLPVALLPLPAALLPLPAALLPLPAALLPLPVSRTLSPYHVHSLPRAVSVPPSPGLA